LSIFCKDSLIIDQRDIIFSSNVDHFGLSWLNNFDVFVSLRSLSCSLSWLWIYYTHRLLDLLLVELCCLYCLIVGCRCYLFYGWAITVWTGVFYMETPWEEDISNDYFREEESTYDEDDAWLFCFSYLWVCNNIKIWITLFVGLF